MRPEREGWSACEEFEYKMGGILVNVCESSGAGSSQVNGC